MAVLHARVLEVRTDEWYGWINKLMLYGETTSNPMRVSHDVKHGHIARCVRPWRFSIPHQAGESLVFLFMRRIVFGPNRLLGRCTLPLDWFPPNQVVREWFPMTDTYAPGTAPVKTMLLLDVHIDELKAGKFKAPFATLRIVPTWVRPADEGTECPAPPQVIFVLPPGAVQFPAAQESRGSSWAAPQAAGSSGQAFYPSVGVTPL
jgi:hypothetical protein